MLQPVQQGESGALHSDERSSLSNEGITCDYCHTAIGHDGILETTTLFMIQRVV